MLEPIAKEIREGFGPAVYAEDAKSLVEVVLDLLRERRATLAVAESCTGEAWDTGSRA